MNSPRKSGSIENSNMITLFVFLGLLNSTFATPYTVGESSGWIIPASGAPTYDSQFSNTKLVVGDTLTFPFQQGAHNVYVVTPTQLTNCDGSNPIQMHTESNAVINLNTTGIWSFICKVPGHCSAGMHLQVTVSAAAAPSAGPTQAPVSTPVRAPVAIPVHAPVSAPVCAPVSAPVRAPVSAPARAPVSAPVHAPVSAPVCSPVSAPTRAPVSGPVRAPVSVPAHAPACAPTHTSLKAPTPAPTKISSKMSPSRSPEPTPKNGAHSAVSMSFAVLLTAVAGLTILML